MKTIKTILRLLGFSKETTIDQKADNEYQLMLDFGDYRDEVLERHDGNPMVRG